MQMVNKDSNAYTVSRRDFLASAACGMAGLALPCGGRGATDLPLAGTVPSLNYWCTWAMQGMTRRLPEWHRKVAAIVGEKGIAGAGYAGNYIFDELVYGPKGWSKSMFPKPLNGVGFPKSRACTGAGRIFGQVDFERKDWRGTDSTNNIVK